MVYLKEFRLPSREAEEKYLHHYYCGGTYGNTYHASTYPFKLFPEMELQELSFSPITILYGSNGSGKSTILNVISQRLHAKRESPYNTSVHMDEYVKMCDFFTDLSWTGEEFDYAGKRSSKYDIGEITRVITSDDIFKALIGKRVSFEQTIIKSQMLILKQSTIKNKKWSDFNFSGGINLETGENLSRYREAVDMRKRSVSEHLRRTLGKEEVGMSNGENSFVYLSEVMQNEGLYLLDEPENSLAPEMQFKLSMLITYMVRHNNCQIIMATHSPFLLATPEAKIYDLDNVPVGTHAFEELEAMQFYYEFFKEKASLFGTPSE